MEKYRIPRRERRKAEKNEVVFKKIKKGSTLLSSALVVSSVVTPIVVPKIAAAAEEDAALIAGNDYTVDAESGVTEGTSDQINGGENSETEETTDNVENAGTEDTLSSNMMDESDILAGNVVDNQNELIGIQSFDIPLASSSRSVNTAAFIAEISGPASIAASENDLYASVMMAQAILESDWGRSALASAPNYNLFGIKGNYQGQSVTMSTWEVINGQVVYIDAAFRKYPSHLESFYDNAYVIRNTSFQTGVYYYSGAWKSNTQSYRDATACLTGRYATDPNYGSKLNNIIETYNLTQYDSPSTGTGTNTGSNTGTNTGSTTNSADTIHTVKSGDSLWSLANQYGTSIAEIKSWNNLSGNTIYVGQKLIVKKGSNTNSNNNNTTNNNSTINNSAATYTVKSGDTLWSIANINGVSVSDLRSWNNLNGDTIYPGQKLVVKKGSTGGSTSNTTNSASATYTVKSGDTLWSIANAHGVSVANLRSWNNLSGDIIHPGQKLIVKNSQTANGNSVSTYTVKSGDTLWGISQKHGVSISQIKQLNYLSGDTIYVSQQLKLR